MKKIGGISQQKQDLWNNTDHLNTFEQLEQTFASLSLKACLPALSVSPPAVSQACLASALDSWTTI